MLIRTAVYGTVRTVVWEDGGGNPASYPISMSSDSGSPYIDFVSLQYCLPDCVAGTIHVLQVISARFFPVDSTWVQGRPTSSFHLFARVLKRLTRKVPKKQPGGHARATNIDGGLVNLQFVPRCRAKTTFGT